MALVGVAEDRQVAPIKRANRQTEKLTQQLNLSVQQAKEVNAIALEAETEVQPLREQKKELTAQIKSIRANKTERIKEVLTTEQLAEYERIRAEREAKKKARRAAKKANPGN